MDNSIQKDNQKPFLVKKFKQAETLKEKIMARIGILFFSLPFISFIIFCLGLYYYSFKVKALLILIALLQNLITSRINFYFKFLQFFQTQKYFKSFTCILEEEINPKNSLFPSHPHGIIGNVISASILNGNISLEKAITFGTRFVRYLPLGGLFARLIGIEGVDNCNFKRRMKEGRNILFIPGGFECATLTDHTKDKVYIKNRKGFIKYALMFGYKVHPVYNFGENRLYYTFKKWKIMESIGLFLNRFKLPGIIFAGKYFVFPSDNVDVCTVVGKGIQFPKIDKPTKNDIDKFHAIYIHQLEELFNRYKDEFGASQKLEIH